MALLINDIYHCFIHFVNALTGIFKCQLENEWGIFKWFNTIFDIIAVLYNQWDK